MGSWCVFFLVHPTSTRSPPLTNQLAACSCQNFLWTHVVGRVSTCPSRGVVITINSQGFCSSFQEQLVLPVSPKRQFPTGLCCLTLGLVVLTSVLVTASVYIYRHYSIAQVGSASGLVQSS